LGWRGGWSDGSSLRGRIREKGLKDAEALRAGVFKKEVTGIGQFVEGRMGNQFPPALQKKGREAEVLHPPDDAGRFVPQLVEIFRDRSQCRVGWVFRVHGDVPHKLVNGETIAVAAVGQEIALLDVGRESAGGRHEQCRAKKTIEVLVDTAADDGLAAQVDAPGDFFRGKGGGVGQDDAFDPVWVVNGEFHAYGTTPVMGEQTDFVDFERIE